MQDTKIRLNGLRLILFETFENNHKKRYYVGILFALLAAVFVGSTNIVGKFLVSSEYSEIPTNPLLVVMFSGFIVALMFTPHARKKETAKHLGRKIIFLIVLVGIVDAVATTLNFEGLKHTSAINASIVGDSEIMFTILMAITVFRERIQRNELLPILMIVVASIAVPFGMNLYQYGENLSSFVLGDLLILSSAMLYAADIGISKHLSAKASPERISQLAALAGSLFVFLLIVMMGVSFDIGWSNLPYIIYFGVIVVGLSYYFFIIALRLIGVIRTTVIYSSTSMFGVVFSVIFLGETVSPFNVLSVLLVIGGVYLLRETILKRD